MFTFQTTPVSIPTHTRTRARFLHSPPALSGTSFFVTAHRDMFPRGRLSCLGRLSSGGLVPPPLGHIVDLLPITSQSVVFPLCTASCCWFPFVPSSHCPMFHFTDPVACGLCLLIDQGVLGHRSQRQHRIKVWLPLCISRPTFHSEPGHGSRGCAHTLWTQHPGRHSSRPLTRPFRALICSSCGCC